MKKSLIVQNLLKKNGIEWQVVKPEKFINPKCKTPESIYDKILRLYEKFPNRNSFSIIDSNIDDLLRMTIITEYNKMPKIIQKLKKQFLDLTGYIRNEKAGYYGIHLHLSMDGLPCEIQLVPEMVRMTMDCLHNFYVKWRSFDANTILNSIIIKKCEIKHRKLTPIDKKIEILKLKKEKNMLLLKVKEQKIELIKCNRIYKKVYKLSGFFKFRNKINNVLSSMGKDCWNFSEIKNVKLYKILNRNLITNGKINKQKVKATANLLEEFVQPIQEKLVFSIKQCLKKDL